jgi:hypothetical protein
MLRSIVALALAAGLAASAAGQTPPGERDRVSYPASFFEQYAPQTALDMVSRLPGFTIDFGAEVRGFGGAAGNVLIEGRRPSAKGNGLEEALRRIPAAQVKEIALIRGADSGEAQGQSVVADVIRVGGGTAGTWKATLERSASGVIYPQLEGSFSLPIGPWSADFKANLYSEEFPSHALRTLHDASGNLIATRHDTRPTRYKEVSTSMEASRPAGRGTLRLNTRGSVWAFDLDLNSAIYDGREPGGVPDARQFYDLDESGWDGEFGADYAIGLNGGWTWTTVALVTASAFIQWQRDHTDRGGVAGDPLAIRLDERPLEALARTSFARRGDSWRPEISTEIAYNRLDSRLSIDAGGAREHAAALIEELRGETRASLGWTIAPAWTLESALAAELSHITVSGDSGEAQTLFYLKPSATLSWTASEALQVRLGASRSVGQLDFSDFAASANSEANQETAGNPSLKPDQTTRVSLAADWRFGTGGALSAELFHDWIKDPLEFIRTEDGGEAIGNVDDARQWGIKGSLTLPLNDVLSGLTLNAEFEYADSEITDAVDGVTRRLSNSDREDPYYSAELRRDDAENSLSYGISYEHGFSAITWRLSERDRLDYGAQWNAFIETTKFAGLKIRLESRSLAGERFRRTRHFYEPDRSGDLVRVEQRKSRRGAFLRLTVSGNF